MPPFKPLADRLWSRVTKTESCWLWTGAISQNGYGVIGLTGGTKNDFVHRVAYRLTKGLIPEGRSNVVDHLCRNRRCVNPDHLELVRQRTNILRGTLGVLKTRCRNGEHPYPEFARFSTTGRRFCIACRRESDRSRSPRRRSA